MKISTFSRALSKFLSENDDIDTRKTTALTIVLTSLKRFSNYSIQVLAFTRIGDGVISQPIFCHTEEDGKMKHKNIYIFDENLLF